MSGHNTSDPCAGGGACCAVPAEFVRLRYFFGQRLGVVDLADEQSYLVGKQRFHNQRLHGAGVLCGLRAERYPSSRNARPTDPTTLLRVRRGAALDACGREIVVGWDQCIDVAAWHAQHPTAGTGSTLRLWVGLCYRECPSDPAPAPRDPCGCEAGGCEFARVREGFELKLLREAEAKAFFPGESRAAGFVPEEVLDTSLEEAFARWAARIAAADCCDAPPAPCLLLASFEARFDAAGQQVVDIAAPDNAIPGRPSILPTALLQKHLLQLLAAAGGTEAFGPGPRLGALEFAAAGSLSGQLRVAMDTAGAELARAPFEASPPLAVKLFRFHEDDGTFEPGPAFAPAYVAGPPRRLELDFGGGPVPAGRYRLLIENDRDQPLADTLMRPLTPFRWVRHFRLVDNGAGTLVLADALFP
jgi:hypothetical protein